METKAIIFVKLEAFIKRFYTNELIKGVILFIGLGLLYFLFTILVEYFLWLPTSGRTILFWLFVTVQIFLLVRFIFFPLFKLFKLQKGINYEQASIIIGNHFYEVNDKLTNFLQLSNQNENSELLLASINQKAETLSPIPFSNAINFNKNKKFLPYAIVPILLLALFFVSGNSKVISQGLDRVVNYNTKYVTPAPFQFLILNKELVTQQNKEFTLQVKTVGNIIPENVSLIIGDEEYLLENTNPGEFQYKFDNVISDVNFSLKANSINSKDYNLKVVNVPTINNFEMILSYPSYLKRKSESIKGTGNAIVPEGTSIRWKLSTFATTDIAFISNNSKSVYSSTNGEFNFSKNISQNTEYQIVTSNKNVKNFEKLDYLVNIVKDQYPFIAANKAPDSLSLKKNFIIGQLSDDYGLSKLQVVYYPKGKPQLVKRGTLAVKNQTVDQFVYSFPTGLNVEQGIVYEYYFEVFDNDAVNNYKSSKSSVFSHNELTDDQKQDELLKDQNDNINSLEKSLNNQDKQLKELDKLQKMKKEKANLDFKDQKKIEDFIKKQKNQDEMMKVFSKKLSENLENFNPKEEDKLKKELLRRLDESQKQSEKNEKLLKELEELQKKLQDDKLFEKADKLKKDSKNQAKNLEQLVELTKRFYVEKKAEQIADKLNKLAEKEDKLANENKNNLEEQKKVADEFEKIKEELQQLDIENKDLKKPMDIPNDKNEQEDVQDDLEKSEEDLKKNDKPSASKSQKSAGKKMKEMSQKMSSSMEGGESQQMEEDAKALRQILDNLLAFSYDEEALIQPTKSSQSRSLALNKILKKQQELKLQFKHVDDSIFAVSLRNPMISEFVLNEIGEIHYNLDQSLETLADNNVSRGASLQQYVLSSANKLADFLSNVQSDMNMQMSGKGKGKGKGMPSPGQGNPGKQLSDIIKKQEGLSEKMKEGMKPGEKPGDNPGDKPGEKPGEGKKDGKGKGENGEGEGSEGNAGKVLEILREQQQLRDALQKSLEQQGINGNNVLNQMKDIEKQLINKGFKNETLQKMLNLKHELLKLENAIQQQGQDEKRKSNTTDDKFSNNASTLPKELQEYIKSIEILNRQSLPLQKNYDQKVKEYFKK
ncbi:glutamyl-tRNA synthetase [Flavobacterium gelidilacus]|uniref:glutamyl-tRNA synthetase n=1 Tax=Flavobacterium gelidilacus TaxID=206041 RepID=UPI000408A9D2|nr:glutamyl-tRNA synthetase [Flavobacterium gelidilacus]